MAVPSTLTSPPLGGPVSAYSTSSQAAHWRFSKQQLSEIRQRSNETAIERLKKAWEEENALAIAEGSTSVQASSVKVFLSVEEELTLVRFYLRKVGGIVRAFNLPEVVEARTMTYIKRFYLRHSCMDHHPKIVMLTCMYLAAKSSNYFMTLASFSKKVSGTNATADDVEMTRKHIISLEFLVSQALGFEYATHGAERAVRGFCLGIQDFKPAPDVDTLRKVATEARSNVSRSRLTDAEFLYTPAQIAFASVRMSNAGRQPFSRFLVNKEARAKDIKQAERAKRATWRAEDKERLAKAAAQQMSVKTKDGKGMAATHSDSKDAASGDKLPDDLTDEQISASPLGMESAALGPLLDTIETLIQSTVQHGSEELEIVKDIDKRLKECQNPAQTPQSHLYRARQEEAEAALAARRKRQTDGAKRNNPFADSGGSGGLFGPELKRRKLQAEGVNDSERSAGVDDVAVSKGKVGAGVGFSDDDE